ncbi:MAG: DUF3108 domain-containing protein [Bacteroidales bacterium]|jgi:hypothetical protein|nr:DUF3108 domain-containing protein [Bacteroidales bacterium]NCU34673.1 DUF3108 domain-containing protein [Candidatus Falkowbacteria bacterium]MDD2633014.1 DUF3108 domain-containing protein [Bacteroidales bacterium]MDD4176703.1 DUF3108 domain-containing protein [Bacteroidales bacterium]MDD4740780.1 DUF3108 domain-containing protein [Bacteroidales bacterium]
MKNIRKIALILFSVLSAIVASAQGYPYRTIENNAWHAGEKLKYKVYYESLLTGKVNAGTATLEVKNSNRLFNGREVYHIVGIGKSNSAFDFFFKVRDRFESYVDKQGIFPHLFIRRTREGNYRKEDDVTFDHKNLKVTSRTETKKITRYIQDIVSASYYARTLSADTLKEGDNISVNFFLDDSAYVSVIQFQGRQIVETELGKFRCLAFKPMVVTGEVFSNPYPMTLWITDDENKLPILVKSAVIVGSVKMELIKYANPRNPIEAKLD